MLLALTGAIVAAVCYGVATVFEAVAVSKMSGLPEGSSITTRVRAGWLYAVGLLVDGIGFALSAAALHLLPLFLAESINASSVAITALLAVVWLRQKLNKSEVIALAVLVIGLITLGVTAKDGPSVTAPPLISWIILIAVAPLAGIAAVLVVKRDGRRQTPNKQTPAYQLDGAKSSPNAYVGGRANGVALAAVAGLAFGMVGVAARLIPLHPTWTDYLADPLLWAVICYGGLAVVVYGFALDRLPTTTAASLCFTVETVFPSAVGLLLLGDEIRTGLWPLAMLGFVFALGACIALSSRSEVEVPDDTR